MNDNIIENNKLIAVFMGLTQDKPSKTLFFNINDCPNAESFEVKYHSSWDWIVPVVNRCINKIGIKTIDECTDYEWNLFTAICGMKVSTPINIANEIVVEFIKWYNEQSK